MTGMELAFSDPATFAGVLWTMAFLIYILRIYDLILYFIDIEYIAGMDCGRPRGDRYPHRSYSTVVEFALCASERSAALRST